MAPERPSEIAGISNVGHAVEIAADADHALMRPKVGGKFINAVTLAPLDEKSGAGHGVGSSTNEGASKSATCLVTSIPHPYGSKTGDRAHRY